MSLNTKRTVSRSTEAEAEQLAALGHVNPMGGVSYAVKNPVARLEMAAASCFFGEPQYYAGTSVARTSKYLSVLSPVLGEVLPSSWFELSPASLLERAIDDALDFDAEATLQLAVKLRQEHHLRATPQVIMVRAARHPSVRGSALIRTYAPGILSRIDEVAAQLAYQMATFGKPIPNALKKAWKAALEAASEYHLAKYRMEGRQSKLVDVANLVHAKSPAIDKLMRGELTLTGRTWEAVVSAGEGSQQAWESALPLLLDSKGHMALLRNLRNLHKHGLLTREVTEALVAGAAAGKQLPFRYYSAYAALMAEGAPGFVLDAIEYALMDSLGRLPRFAGRVASLCDNSGSAQGATTSSMGTIKVSTIANLTGVLTGMVADEGYVGIFGDKLEMVPVRARSSVFDQLRVLERQANSIGQSTEKGIWLFFEQAIRNKEHWDHIFVYSDMQAGHGGLYGEDASEYRDYRWNGSRYIDVPALVAEYRKKVNPKVMVYLVQVAGYQDSLMPEFYDRTYILGGWSDGILRFAHAMSATVDSEAPLAS